jgi:hypothetical protein
MGLLVFALVHAADIQDRRGDALEKRRAFMTEWAGFLSTTDTSRQK